MAGISTTAFRDRCWNLTVEPDAQKKRPEVSTHRSEERLLDLLGEDMEHVHGFCRQGKIGAGHALVLSELGLTGLLLILGDTEQRPSKVSTGRELPGTPSAKENGTSAQKAHTLRGCEQPTPEHRPVTEVYSFQHENSLGLSKVTVARCLTSVRPGFLDDKRSLQLLRGMK